MKIATFNINGIKARLPRLVEWLEETRPDIACLQELKSSDETMPTKEIEAAGYGFLYHGQKGFNGVAILARGADPVEIQRGLAGEAEDEQSRYLEADIHGLRVASIYLPNGNPQPGPRRAPGPQGCPLPCRSSHAAHPSPCGRPRARRPSRRRAIVPGRLGPLHSCHCPPVRDFALAPDRQRLTAGDDGDTRRADAAPAVVCAAALRVLDVDVCHATGHGRDGAAFDSGQDAGSVDAHRGSPAGATVTRRRSTTATVARR